MSRSLRSFNCTRSTLSFVTFVLFLCGLISLAIGLWITLDPMYTEPAILLDTENYLNVGYLILVSSSILIVFTVLGAMGLRNENEKILSIYVVGLFIILFLSISAIILTVSYGFDEKLEEYLARQINLNIQKLYENERANSLINFIQIKFRCCGANYLSDYEKYRIHYPVSCTNEYYGNPNFLYFEGCAYKITKFYETRAAIILGIFSFIIVFVLIAITFTVMFYCSLFKLEINE